MMNKYELRQRYVAAICAFGDATTIIYQHLSVGTFPSAAELRREEDARGVLEVIRTEYFCSMADAAALRSH